MNTPLNAAPISGRDGLPQPTVATIGEDEEDEAVGGNPASVLARVSIRENRPCTNGSDCLSRHCLIDFDHRTPLCST